jgi:hypothetical protein
VKLAGLTAVILLMVGLPIAYWLTSSRWRWKFLVESVVALPLVLPPTVLGFYVLVAIGPKSLMGQWYQAVTGAPLVFTFEGLVVASVLYSLPFAVQPFAAAFGAVDPKLVEASWTLGISRLETFWRVTPPLSAAGLVTGIRDVTQGRGLDIKPYGLVSSLASPGRGKPAMTTDASAGLDLFYNPTPLLRANLTVNTDFAQTEVDQRQVNLTRYSLFFPEQRDFFLDGATFFDFASSSGGGDNVYSPVGRNDEERIIPFFSRRIGLSADATPQKIDFGTKVTGQAGAQDVGLLHVRTGEDDGFRSEDFTVARAKRRVLRQSHVGGLYTRRDPRLADIGATHTAGLDARLATSTFLGDRNLEGDGWFLYSSRPGFPAGMARSGPRCATRTTCGTHGSTRRRYRRTSTRPSASSRAALTASTARRWSSVRVPPITGTSAR